MKYQIKIDDRIFEVEIHDLQARPIIAVVDGEPIEVWPQDGQQTLPPYPTAHQRPESKPLPKMESSSPTQVGDKAKANAVNAPIPGVIVSITVKSGDAVVFGQELCILEAMKMKNAIRATRAGIINTVYVSPGQQVNHHDILMDYVES